MTADTVRTTGRYAFRDFVIDGVASSGDNEPDKGEARIFVDSTADVLALLELNQATGGAVFTTKAQADANLNYDAFTLAQVVADTALLNGIYQKQGASGAGSWLKISDGGLGAILNRLTVLEATNVVECVSTGGTPGSVYQANPSTATVSAYSRSQLYVFPFGSENTIATPTFKVGSLAALPIYDADSNLLQVGDLKANFAVLLRYNPNFGGIWNVVAGRRNTLPVAFLTATGATTANAIVTTADATYPALSQNRLMIYTHQGARNTVAGPTLQVGATAAKPLCTPDGVAIGIGRMIAGMSYIFEYVNSSGGFWRLLSPLAPDPNQRRSIRVSDLDTGTADAFNGQSSIPELFYSNTTRYLFTPVKGPNTIAGVTFKVDALAALQIYDEPRGDLVAPGRIQAGVTYELDYIPSFGGYWMIRSPKLLPRSTSEVLRAQQSADAMGRSLRNLYRASSAFTGIVRTQIYEELFDAAPSVDGFRVAHGTGPNVAATYDTLVWNAADGGYGSAVFSASAGFLAWWDWNHVYPGPGFLNLFMVVGSGGGGGGLPLPIISDCRNLKITMRLRVLGLTLPNGSRLVFHIQTVDKSVDLGGTGKAFNLVYLDTILDEALSAPTAARKDAGFGLGFPPQVATITDSGEVEIIIYTVPDDAWWLLLGGSIGRADTYRPATADYALNRPLANMQIQILHPQQPDPQVPPPNRPVGELRISYLKIEKPV